jgi:hypothetical protein
MDNPEKIMEESSCRQGCRLAFREKKYGRTIRTKIMGNLDFWILSFTFGCTF